MKVLILPNFEKENCFDVVSRVIDQLNKDNVEVLALDDAKNNIKHDISFISRENINRDISFAIAIGGDGTIIKAANLILEYDIPLIGINLGTLGFLAGIEKDEIELLHNLVVGKYEIE